MSMTQEEIAKISKHSLKLADQLATTINDYVKTNKINIGKNFGEIVYQSLRTLVGATLDTISEKEEVYKNVDSLMAEIKSDIRTIRSREIRGEK